MGKFADALLEEAKSYKDTEWTGTLGSKEVTLVSRPITPADLQTLARLGHPEFAKNPTMEGMVEMLILKARDPADGNKAFDKGDRPVMMKVGTNKIGEIFAALFGNQLAEDSEEGFEERVGNLKKTAGE